MNTILIFAVGSIFGFAAARLKSMRYFQKPDQAGGEWIFVQADQVPAVLYAMDPQSAATTLDRLFVSKER